METERHYTKIDILSDLICLIGIAVILFSFRTDIYNLVLSTMVFNGKISYRGYLFSSFLSFYIPSFLTAMSIFPLDSIFWRIKAKIQKTELSKNIKEAENGRSGI